MGTLIDLKGRRFGQLVVIERASDQADWPGAHWLCQCDCDTMKVVYGQNLRRGRTVSCGCKKKTHPGNLKHGYGRDGEKRTSEYLAWVNMRQRCNNPNVPQYADYGGRGITVDPAWDSFEQFLSDVGPRPTQLHSLDRIDNDQPYGPRNCCWATREAQNANRRNLGTKTMQRLPDYLEDCVSFLERHIGDIPPLLRDRLQELV